MPFTETTEAVLLSHKVMVKLSNLCRSIQRIYISNIPWTCTSKEVIEYLSEFGNVTGGKVYFDRNTGLSKKYGFFDTNDDQFLKNIGKQSTLCLERNILRVSLQKDHRIALGNCFEV